MRFLRTGIYLFAEFLFLYALLTGGVYVFFSLATGWNFTVGLLFALWAAVCIPFCLVGVTVGPQWLFGQRSELVMHGFYRPWRPLAMIGWSNAALGDGRRGAFGNRHEQEIWFESDDGVTAYDVVDRLSQHLDDQGLEHSKLGGLIVRDGGTRWGVDPDGELPLLTVWADTRQTRHHAQVVAGVEQFLCETMGLRLT